MTQYLTHLHDKGTYAAILGVVTWALQELNIDGTIKILVGLFTLGVLFYTILEKRLKIRLTKLQIACQKKEHNLTEED